MIIARSPLRISFAGGGTDLKAFYEKESGSVTSITIDKYVYIAVHKYFENKILLKYSQIELVDRLDDIKNELIRECLRLLNITKGIEITAIADLPTRTGLGSSSSFTVALLHALHAFKGEHVSREQLAREAVEVEVQILKRPIGKQDHYATAYGGLNFIEFNPDDSVVVTPVVCGKEIMDKLERNLILFYTGMTRSASDILKEQRDRTEEKRETLRKMKNLSEEVARTLVRGDLDRFGSILHENWIEKKKITDSISNPRIDEWYELGIRAGAKGGKILGAGGGGFLLFYCDRESQDKVRMALKELKEVKVRFTGHGSQIIHVGD